MDTEAIKQLAGDVNNVAQAAFESGYKKGYIDGLTGYAWWKDGIQYVGTSGTTLKAAIEAAKD